MVFADNKHRALHKSFVIEPMTKGCVREKTGENRVITADATSPLKGGQSKRQTEADNRLPCFFEK